MLVNLLHDLTVPVWRHPVKKSGKKSTNKKFKKKKVFLLFMFNPFWATEHPTSDIYRDSVEVIFLITELATPSRPTSKKLKTFCFNISHLPAPPDHCKKSERQQSEGQTYINSTCYTVVCK